MREVRSEIDIETPPAAVWQVLTDFAEYPEWNPFVRRARGSATPGSRLDLRMRPLGRRWRTSRPVVVRALRDRELRLHGRAPLPGLLDGEHVVTIEALPEGGSRLTQREVFKGLLTPLVWHGLQLRTRRGIEKMNRALKVRAEAGTS